MRAALYTRVSTEEQSRYGYSLSVQLEALQVYAEERNYNVVGVFEEAGVSAKIAAIKRPQLQSLLAMVQSKQVDIILFTKLDRWSRNVAQYCKVQEILDKYGVVWRTIWEDYETETSGGRFTVNIMLSIAQAESERTGERVKAVKQALMDKGVAVNGRAPLGYKVEDKRLVPDPDTAPIANDMFRYYIATHSVAGTRKYLFTQYGKHYSYTHMKRLLSNPRYIGRFESGVEACEPIVDRTDFDLAQSYLSIRQTRTTAHPKIYLFSGLVWCAECGHRLVTHTSKGYRYHRCPNYPLGLCTHRVRMNEDRIEEYMLTHLLPAVTAYNAEAKQKKIKHPTTDKAAIRCKMDKIKDLYVDGFIDREEMQRRMKPLQIELETPEPPVPEEIPLPGIRSALDIYQTLDPAQRKEFWTRTLSRIDITATGDITFTLRSI